MTDHHDLISHLRRNAGALEHAAAHDYRSSPALVASSVDLMRWAAEALQADRREIQKLRAVGGICTMREIYMAMRSMGFRPLEVAGLLDRIEELKEMERNKVG